LFAQDDDEVFVTDSTLYAGEEVKPPLVITPVVFCCRRTDIVGQNPAGIFC